MGVGRIDADISHPSFLPSALVSLAGPSLQPAAFGQSCPICHSAPDIGIFYKADPAVTRSLFR